MAKQRTYRPQPHAGPASLDDHALSRMIDVALARADEEAELYDALDRAVDALGQDAVRHALHRLAELDGRRRAG